MQHHEESSATLNTAFESAKKIQQAAAESVVERRNTIPILANVLLESGLTVKDVFH